MIHFSKFHLKFDRSHVSTNNKLTRVYIIKKKVVVFLINDIDALQKNPTEGTTSALKLFVFVF